MSVCLLVETCRNGWIQSPQPNLKAAERKGNNDTFSKIQYRLFESVITCFWYDEIFSVRACKRFFIGSFEPFHAKNGRFDQQSNTTPSGDPMQVLQVLHRKLDLNGSSPVAHMWT